MIRQLQKLVLFLALTGYAISGNAAYEKTKIGNLTYYIINNSSGNYAEVCAPEEGNYSGDIVIPEEVTYKNVTYPVTSISGYAFSSDPITSVSIPNSIKEIRINAFLSCKELKEIRIPASVEEIGVAVFMGCRQLKTVIFEDGDKTLEFGTQSNAKSSKSFENTQVDSLYMGRRISRKDGMNPFDGMSSTLRALKFGDVYNNASLYFSNFTSLKNVYLSDNTTNINTDTFSGCTALESIALPKGLKNIGNSAFQNCTALTSIVIPDSVTNIGGKAFSGCSNLSSITIPASVKSIGSEAFRYCKLKEFYLFAKLSYNDYKNCFGLAKYGEVFGRDFVIYAYKSEHNAIMNALDNHTSIIRDIELPYHLSVSKSLGSITFSVVANKYVSANLKAIRFKDTEITPDENGQYLITNLTPDTSYIITIIHTNEDGEEKSYNLNVETKKPNVNAYCANRTQTTMSLAVNAASDTTCSANKKGFYYNSQEYDCTEGEFILRNLTPNQSYSITPFADYGTKRIIGESRYLATSSLTPAITAQHIGPTSISVKGSYTLDDAHVSETGFTDNEKGNTLILTGLKPNKDYTVEYYVKTEEGSNEKVSETFTTPALNLTTLQPRCVSSTCAIVAAETNISDDEVNAGFQWKKYDAPESLKPSEGYASIYNGQLEGYIKNLQSAFYYNVRAFYKSADDTYYYGDWVTFDPSDFSYFEPTVHTYEAREVTDRSARVKGYVLAGTEDITEQGFEYWLTDRAENRVMRVQAAKAEDEDVFTVIATGQVMTAELTDLQPGSTYTFRSFVRTATGTTYGEEQTFTTDAPTGINDVESEATAPTIMGYYDLSGRRHSEPQKGMNIIRYSDGTARKILVK